MEKKLSGNCSKGVHTSLGNSNQVKFSMLPLLQKNKVLFKAIAQLRDFSEIPGAAPASWQYKYPPGVVVLDPLGLIWPHNAKLVARVGPRKRERGQIVLRGSPNEWHAPSAKREIKKRLVTSPPALHSKPARILSPAISLSLSLDVFILPAP